MRLRLCSAFLCVWLVACASSTPGGQPDAEPVGPADAAVDAVPPDAGPPDAEPCIPDVDGETCNGEDDDCDGTTDEGFPGVGEDCSVGVGACAAEGVTQCTADGLSTECGATAGTPGDELCGNGDDDDCDTMTDEGFPDLGMPCSVGTGACHATGVFVCSGTGLSTTCNATPGDPLPETCNGMDEDCDLLIDEGFNVNQACDSAADSDLCLEGVYACDGAGGVMCTDGTGSTFDVCNGADDDCDPTSADGSEDGSVGVACDGAGDSDLCLDALTTCSGGGVVCVDNSPSTLDLCGNGDEDCDPSSADGSEQPGYGQLCDGGDGDLCQEGTRVCSGTSLVCSDNTGTTTDLCGNGDEDCDPASADGSEHPGIGAACDGGDSDSCVEGNNVCSGTSLACNDATGSTVELCAGNAVDEDCDGSLDEGFNLNDSPTCGTPFYVGSLTGDSGVSSITDSWYDEEWDRVRFTENDDGIDYVKGTISLYSPPGVDFDLYVYCVSCGGTLIGSSALGGLTGHTDTVNVSNDDDWPGWDDSFDVIVEIRYWSSNRCAYWTLTATGDTGTETNNCDP